MICRSSSIIVHYIGLHGILLSLELWKLNLFRYFTLAVNPISLITAETVADIGTWCVGAGGKDITRSSLAFIDICGVRTESVVTIILFDTTASAKLSFYKLSIKTLVLRNAITIKHVRDFQLKLINEFDIHYPISLNFVLQTLIALQLLLLMSVGTS